MFLHLWREFLCSHTRCGCGHDCTIAFGGESIDAINFATTNTNYHTSEICQKNAKAIYKLKIKLKENLHIQIPFLSHFLTSISSSFMAMDYVDICTLGDQVDNAQTRMVINIRESTSYATR